MTKLQKKTLARFVNPEFNEIDGTLIIHLDKPDLAEVQRRVKEVQGGLMIEDDCPLCQDLAKNKPEVVLYDQDSILCLGQDFVSGLPVKKAVA